MKDNPSTVGLGIDRIVTLLTESSSIRNIVEYYSRNIIRGILWDIILFILNQIISLNYW